MGDDCSLPSFDKTKSLKSILLQIDPLQALTLRKISEYSFTFTSKQICFSDLLGSHFSNLIHSCPGVYYLVIYYAADYTEFN
jgi:hypothetical protein